MIRVLIVDDEVKLLRLLAALFGEHDYQVVTATRAEDAEKLLQRDLFDLLVTDIRLPRRSGIDLMKAALALQPDLQVIVISAYGTVSGAVEAMRLGAFDYLLKPFEMEGLLLVAQRALEAGRLKRENLYLRSRERNAQPGHRLVVRSPAMRRAATLMERVGSTNSTVLLLGESGAGKELAAETIHAASPRSARPLVRVNCPAIPRDLVESELFGHVQGAFTGAQTARKGKFELADGGTLFLDEVGDLPLVQQGKLLHVLESHNFSRVGSSHDIQVDVRILAATNRDLAEQVEKGEFRSDLYYRLNVFPIRIPPLRERLDDLPGLILELLHGLTHRLNRPNLELEEDGLHLLAQYPWPGNVRELRNVLERAAVLASGSTIRVEDLPPELLDGARNPHPTPAEGCQCLTHQVEAFKVQVILEALRESGWRKKDAAEKLGLSPRALSHYVQRHDLDQFR